jgi:hypothetical protein
LACISLLNDEKYLSCTVGYGRILKDLQAERHDGAASSSNHVITQRRHRQGEAREKRKMKTSTTLTAAVAVAKLLLTHILFQVGVLFHDAQKDAILVSIRHAGWERYLPYQFECTDLSLALLLEGLESIMAVSYGLARLLLGGGCITCSLHNLSYLAKDIGTFQQNLRPGEPPTSFDRV